MIINVIVALCIKKSYNDMGDIFIKNIDKEHITLRMPKIYLYIFLVAITMTFSALVCMILYPNETVTLWVLIFFISAFVLEICFFFELLIWKIDIFKSKDYFVLRTLPFAKHSVNYNDCEWYKEGDMYFQLKTNKKTITLTYNILNLPFFMNIIRENKVPKYILQKHSIRYPKDYLFIGVLLFLFIFPVSLITAIDYFDFSLEYFLLIAFLFALISIPVWFVLKYYNWKIDIEGNEFIYRNILRKSYRFKFCDSFIKYDGKEILIIVVGNKKIFVDQNLEGLTFLKKHIKNCCKN